MSLRVRWEGPFFQVQSLARVNRELVLALLRRGLDVACVPLGDETPDAFPADRFAPLKDRMHATLPPADVVVRHGYPPRFEAPPGGAPLVVIAPWEFGYVPQAWAQGARGCAEVWGPSRYVRDCWQRSGVPHAAVIPNGVDPEVFAPGGDPPEGPFRFLFVGGAIERKGVDLLLEAFREAFTAADDATLVIKDALAGGIYRLQSMRERIQATPGVIYQDADIEDEELVALYRNCHAFAFPTRGEGYGLPLAEAQACGLPVITTGYGGAMNFCDAADGWLVAARLETVPGDRLRHEECAGIPFWAVPERAALVAALRAAHADRAATRRKGLAAAARMRTAHTWDHAAALAAERLAALAAPGDTILTSGTQVLRGDPPATLPASLVVVARNARAETQTCIESILAYTPLHPERCELIVVDNASSDGTETFLASVAQARVIRVEEPLAPSAAFNLGLRAARGRVRVAMHNDVAVSKGWLERFLAAFPHDGRATVAGPRSNHASGVQQMPVPYVNLRGMQRFAFDLGRTVEPHRKRMEVATLDAFCIGMNEAAFATLGFFDETFTHRFYSEDLCIRARAAGADVVCAGDVFVHHEGGVGFRENQVDLLDAFRRDRAPFMRRHHPRRTVAMLRVEDHAATLPRVLAFLETCVDEIVALDNGSTDDSADLLRACPRVVELQRQGFERAVSQNWAALLEMAARRAPDWVLALEGDEIPEDRFAADLPNLVNPEPESIAAHTFAVHHFWSEDRVRTDPGWSGHRVGALFRWRPGLVYGAGWEERIPQGIAGNTIYDHALRLKHLGFLDADRRAAEFAATRRGGVELPDAEPLTALWCEAGDAPGHDNYRSLLLERIPANARRVLVVAADPSWWGGILHAWGKAEVVGWATPGGSASEEDLDAIHALTAWDLRCADLPYPDGHFDAVVLADVLGRVADPAAAIRGLRVLISESGALVASFPGGCEPDDVRALAGDLAVARLEGVQAPGRPGVVSQFVLVACPREEAVAALYQVRVPTLSACLIVKNEEAVLARCLQSVRAVCDEIVVVDTGSTDRSVEIAERFGAKVYHHPWRDDFADARNVSLAHATCGWILVMDADEVLDPGSVPMLRKVLLSGDVAGRIRMYYLREINYFMKGDLAQEASEHQNMRLFPNRPDIRFVGRIHEQVKYVGDGEEAMSPGAPEATPPEGVVVERFTTPILLHHYGYVDQEWARKGRDERNMTLLRRAVAENPDDAFNHFNLACHVAHTQGNATEALAEFQRAIDLIGPEGSTGYLPLCYILAAMALLDLGRPAEGLPYVEKALQKFPDLPDAHYSAGYIHAHLGNKEAAREHYRQAVQNGGKPFGYLGSTDASASTWKPNMELGLLEMQDERFERALEYFLKALHYKPDMPALWANRARCHLHLGDMARAGECFAQAYALGFRDPRMLEDLAAVSAALGKLDEAIRVGRECFAATGEARHAKLLGHLLARAERWEEAVAMLESAGSLDIDTALVRAAARIRLGRHAEARVDLEEALRQRPRSAAIHNNLAAVALAEHAIEAARHHYEQALALDPALREARMNLIELELQLGRSEAARIHADALAAVHPRDAAVALFVAGKLCGMGDPAAAVPVLATAIPFARDAVPLQRAAADAARAAGNPALAVDLLRQAHERAPSDADVLCALGRILLELGDYAAAEQALAAALTHAPRHGEARMLLEGLRALERAWQADAQDKAIGGAKTLA